MNLNPVVIIPTYWSGRRQFDATERHSIYDHTTSIDRDGELPRCLDSLRKVRGLGRIALLVVAESGVENQAVEKVATIVQRFPDLNINIIGDPELRHIHRRFDQIGMGDFDRCASLTGYGAIRNLGILVASIFGHDTAIFIDDDEVVQHEDFLERALYGIGAKTPSGSIITAKTGFFLDAHGNYTAPENTRWNRRLWDSNAAFNEYITRAVNGPRLSRANTACGGCMILHADAYGSVAFDPWITRGEDLDYVLSARMYGIDVWFDNQLYLQHLPPDNGEIFTRFEQDVYRWFYENRKVEFGKTQIDLLQVTPSSLAPYPGPWLTRTINRRARLTAYMGAIAHKEHMTYWRIGNAARKDAADYARNNCANYFEFQHQWPSLVRGMWNCTPLATQLSGARRVRSANPAFTGRFSAITGGDDDGASEQQADHGGAPGEQVGMDEGLHSFEA